MSRVHIKPMTPLGPLVRFDLAGNDTLTGGIGGWSELPRPRRRAAVEWIGTPLAQLVLPLLLDGTEITPGVDAVIEPTLRTVMSWGRKTAGTGQPPLLRATGPIAATEQQRWVLNDIEWGTMIRNRKEQRVQQYLTLTLLEFREAEVLASPAANWNAGRT